MKCLYLAVAGAAALALFPAPVAAQHQHGHGTPGHRHPTLHVNPRWKECSFQLHPDLTQSAWRQFAREAGLVAYFRPLAGARPMGRGNFEVSVLQWETAIDDADAAWNDTFVHPDSTHWLFQGHGLKFPGLTLRAGVTSRTDVGVYVTKNPNANYGFIGGQVQHLLAGSAERGWSAAGRLSAVSLFGPEDLEFTVVGADLLASRDVRLARWATLSPYAGVSAYVSNARETTAAVNLRDERVPGGQAMVGATLDVFNARLGVEYNVSKVNSLSLKLGMGW